MDVCPPDAGKVQRRVIQVDVGGEKVWREFDIVRTFEGKEGAIEYADKNGIKDVEF